MAAGVGADVPDVSILTPVFNGWEYLEQCAASIYAQKGGPRWDWWIGINGHGPAGGAAVDAAHRVAAAAPPGTTVHVVNLHPLEGKVAALNALVERAAAPWIAVLDCDDVWLPGKLAAQWAALAGPAAGADCIGTQCTYFETERGRNLAGPRLPIGWISKEAVYASNPIINSSVLLRRELAHWTDRCGLEDYDLWLRLAAAGRRLYSLAEPLVVHRLHAGSAFNGKGKQDLVGLRAHWRPIFEGIQGAQPQGAQPQGAQPPALATVVSAYYNIRSKFPPAKYIEWITPFWSKTYCPLVFFTSPQLAPTFEEIFKARPGPTRVVPLPLEDLAAFHKLAPQIWTRAHALDPEKGSVGHSPELYALWYEKKEFVARAIALDPFKTTGFVWCDAGICRYPEWIPQLATRFPLESQIPRGKMLVLTIDPFKEADAVAKTDGIRGDFTGRNSVGGGILASDRSGWEAWSRAYDAMLMRYYLAGRFVGKDQNIMGSMLLEDPALAACVPRFTALTPQQSWFSLLFYLAGLEPK